MGLYDADFYRAWGALSPAPEGALSPHMAAAQSGPLYQSPAQRGLDLRGMALTDTPGAGISNHFDLMRDRIRSGALDPVTRRPTAPEERALIYGEIPFLREVSERFGLPGVELALKELYLRDARDSASEMGWWAKNRRIGM